MSDVSVAEAKNQLPRLLKQAEAGEPVHITRRGRAVAVLLSESEFARLSGGAAAHDPFQAILRWRARADLDEVDLSPAEVDPSPAEVDPSPAEVDGWRDRGEAAPFDWPE
ncbi:MAG: type II toxin-antitoxin system Phd/YefM family antitoxin [Gammaproteobacteria bacterium]